jgi:hypothetical protein
MKEPIIVTAGYTNKVRLCLADHIDRATLFRLQHEHGFDLSGLECLR